jgi:hypothetical protein
MQSTGGLIKKFRLLTLEKFGAHRDHATEPDGRSKQDGRTGESDEQKKRYSTTFL